MPTTYAHDAFGRKVLKQLPGELQELIQRHIGLYRIGLHGPDILFYHTFYANLVNQTGVRYHKELASRFFEKGVELVQEEKDEALLAYLLGFACHFMLDSTCHPYIMKIEEQISHTVIEKELDRFLMEKDGLDALTYFPAKCILPAEEHVQVIAKMFPQLTEAQIMKSLKGMRRMTGWMVYGDGKIRRILMPVLTILGKRHELGDHFMTKEPVPGCQHHLDILYGFYVRALEEAPELLEGLVRSVDMSADLPRRFHRTYEG